MDCFENQIILFFLHYLNVKAFQFRLKYNAIVKGFKNTLSVVFLEDNFVWLVHRYKSS